MWSDAREGPQTKISARRRRGCRTRKPPDQSGLKGSGSAVRVGTVVERSHLTNFRKGLKTSSRRRSTAVFGFLSGLETLLLRRCLLCFLVRLRRVAGMRADAGAAGMGKETTEAGRRCSAMRGAGRIGAQLSIVFKILMAPKSVSNCILLPDDIIHTGISISIPGWWMELCPNTAGHAMDGAAPAPPRVRSAVVDEPVNRSSTSLTRNKRKDLQGHKHGPRHHTLVA